LKGGDLHGGYNLRHDGPGQYQAQQQDIFSGQHRQEPDGAMTDIRKPYLKSFTIKELMQFIDHYAEHKEMLHIPGHPWEVCDLLARFFGFGYSRQWSQDETNILAKNYPDLGAEKTSDMLLLRTAYDCSIKARILGLRTNVKQAQKSRCSWSLYELEILTKYYSIINSKVMALLPGRTERACVAMARNAGLVAPSSGTWSPEEIEVLKKGYSEMGPQVKALLPDRSITSVATMAQRIGIRAPVKKWTNEEDDIIRTHFSQMGPGVASLLNGRRTETVCYRRARTLGVLFSAEEIKWSDSELAILKEHYPQIGSKTHELLPGRTASACQNMAARLNLTCRAKSSGGNKKWSEEELEILKEYYSELGADVHKLLPGRSEAACDAMAYRLGISPPDSKKIPVRWTDEEIEVLKTNYHKLGKDVAALLPGRTAASCQIKASSLGLIYRKYFWSETEDAILKVHYPKEGDSVVRRLPNRTKDSCVTRANQLGLHRLKSTDDAIPQPDAADIREQPACEAALDDEGPPRPVSPEDAGLTAPAMSAAIETAQELEETPQAQEEESSAFQFGLTQM